MNEKTEKHVKQWKENVKKDLQASIKSPARMIWDFGKWVIIMLALGYGIHWITDQGYYCIYDYGITYETPFSEHKIIKYVDIKEERNKEIIDYNKKIETINKEYPYGIPQGYVLPPIKGLNCKMWYKLNETEKGVSNNEKY